jgi:hypothetical protein
VWSPSAKQPGMPEAATLSRAPFEVIPPLCDDQPTPEAQGPRTQCHPLCSSLATPEDGDLHTTR